MSAPGAAGRAGVSEGSGQGGSNACAGEGHSEHGRRPEKGWRSAVWPGALVHSVHVRVRVRVRMRVHAREHGEGGQWVGARWLRFPSVGNGELPNAFE